MTRRLIVWLQRWRKRYCLVYRNW